MLYAGSNGDNGAVVILAKPIKSSEGKNQIAEHSFINLVTEKNISFGKGFVVLRHKYYRDAQNPEPIN